MGGVCAHVWYRPERTSSIRWPGSINLVPQTPLALGYLTCNPPPGNSTRVIFKSKYCQRHKTLLCSCWRNWLQGVKGRSLCSESAVFSVTQQDLTWNWSCSTVSHLMFRSLTVPTSKIKPCSRLCFTDVVLLRPLSHPNLCLVIFATNLSINGRYHYSMSMWLMCWPVFTLHVDFTGSDLPNIKYSSLVV